MRISLDADGAVQGFLDPRFLSPEHVGDACRLLNELGVPALSTRHVAYLRNRTRDRNGCILAFVDRRWRILESGHEIPALLHGLGRRQFRDPTCTELAIWWLSGSHRSADMGVPYARHVAAWAARTISKDAVAAVLRGASPVLGCLDEPRMLDRLLDVAPLLPSLSIRERGAIIRLAERVVRAAIGRSRRPRILDSRRSIVERIVLALGRDLSERLLSRAIPWLLGSFEGLASQEARRSSPEGPLRPVIDPRWRQLAALPTSSARVRAFIRQAAYNSLYALCAEGIALSSEAADDWLWCIEQQVASESGWRLESSLEKVSLVEQGVSAALSDDELSRGIRRRIDALRSLIPRDVAAAGETEPELRAA